MWCSDPKKQKQVISTRDQKETMESKYTSMSVLGYAWLASSENRLENVMEYKSHPFEICMLEYGSTAE